jgi:ABC-type nitrate/sulfonate/bicarbonate transport system substrate-binding protein
MTNRISHNNSSKVTLAIVFISIIIALAAAIVILSRNTNTVRIGNTGSPLLAPLYYAEKSSRWDSTFRLVRLATSADQGYALMSGDLDIAFIEPSKALIIKNLPGFAEIDVIGKVTYPYGAVLAVRKGLNLRIQDLAEHRVAVSEPTCNLYHAFLKDLSLFGVDREKIKFEYIPFDAMIPALESGTIDAVLTKGSYSVIARKLGHTIPYLQWDIAAGDECCPAIISQTEFLLLARKNARESSALITKLLLESAKADPSVLRKIVSDSTGIPVQTLESFPLPSFSLANAPLLQLFEDHAKEEAEEKHGSIQRKPSKADI